VAWNEKYGYVSSYDAVEQVPRDGDTFCAQVRTKCRRQRELWRRDGCEFAAQIVPWRIRGVWRPRFTPTTRKVVAA